MRASNDRLTGGCHTRAAIAARPSWRAVVTTSDGASTVRSSSPARVTPRRWATRRKSGQVGGVLGGDGGAGGGDVHAPAAAVCCSRSRDGLLSYPDRRRTAGSSTRSAISRPRNSGSRGGWAGDGPLVRPRRGGWPKRGAVRQRGRDMSCAPVHALRLHKPCAYVASLPSDTGRCTPACPLASPVDADGLHTRIRSTEYADSCASAVTIGIASS